MNRSRFKKIYNYYIHQNYGACNCFVEKVIQLQQGDVDPTQTTNQRIAHALTNGGQGGRLSFGLLGLALKTNSLGRIEGQIGGSGTPLRNRF